jgi:hypothetical protein
VRPGTLAFAVVCAALVGGAALLSARGVDLFPDASHAVVPSTVRGAPGAFRAYHSAGGGFRGGK